MLLILQAVGSSHETSAAPASLPSAWNGTWTPQIYGNETTTMLPNQTKVTKALRCEVCKLDVNSKDSYESHIAGKKHKKNLQVQTNPTIASHANVQTDTSDIQGQALIGPKQPEPKKQVDSATVCSTCNVLCTSQDAYIKHVGGRKHAAQVSCKLRYPFVRLRATVLYIFLFSPYSISQTRITFTVYRHIIHTLVWIISYNRDLH